MDDMKADEVLSICFTTILQVDNRVIHSDN